MHQEVKKADGSVRLLPEDTTERVKLKLPNTHRRRPHVWHSLWSCMVLCVWPAMDDRHMLEASVSCCLILRLKGFSVLVDLLLAICFNAQAVAIHDGPQEYRRIKNGACRVAQLKRALQAQGVTRGRLGRSCDSGGGAVYNDNNTGRRSERFDTLLCCVRAAP